MSLSFSFGVRDRSSHFMYWIIWAWGNGNSLNISHHTSVMLADTILSISWLKQKEKNMNRTDSETPK